MTNLESEAVEMFRILLNNAGGYIKDVIDPTLPTRQRHQVRTMVDHLGQELLSVLNRIYPDYERLGLEDLDL